MSSGSLRRHARCRSYRQRQPRWRWDYPTLNCVCDWMWSTVKNWKSIRWNMASSSSHAISDFCKLGVPFNWIGYGIDTFIVRIVLFLMFLLFAWWIVVSIKPPSCYSRKKYRRDLSFCALLLLLWLLLLHEADCLYMILLIYYLRAPYRQPRPLIVLSFVGAATELKLARVWHWLTFEAGRESSVSGHTPIELNRCGGKTILRTIIATTHTL